MTREDAVEPLAATALGERDCLLRRGLRLEYTTLTWNVLGSAIVLIAAILAGSVALVGFGLDSLIEIFASLVVVWHLKNIAEARERRALRLIGLAFVGLAVYLSAQAVYALVTGAEPTTSPVGIAWVSATFVAMLLLAAGKARTGRALGNRVLVSEERNRWAPTLPKRRTSGSSSIRLRTIRQRRDPRPARRAP
jgi:divalent metal cation (Fe/Co/Zn/Cd) transporter